MQTLPISKAPSHFSTKPDLATSFRYIVLTHSNPWPHLPSFSFSSFLQQVCAACQGRGSPAEDFKVWAVRCSDRKTVRFQGSVPGGISIPDWANKGDVGGAFNMDTLKAAAAPAPSSSSSKTADKKPAPTSSSSTPSRASQSSSSHKDPSPPSSDPPRTSSKSSHATAPTTSKDQPEPSSRPSRTAYRPSSSSKEASAADVNLAFLKAHTSEDATDGSVTDSEGLDSSATATALATTTAPTRSLNRADATADEDVSVISPSATPSPSSHDVGMGKTSSLPTQSSVAPTIDPLTQGTRNGHDDDVSIYPIVTETRAPARNLLAGTPVLLTNLPSAMQAIASQVLRKPTAKPMTGVQSTSIPTRLNQAGAIFRVPIPGSRNSEGAIITSAPAAFDQPGLQGEERGTIAIVSGIIVSGSTVNVTVVDGYTLPSADGPYTEESAQGEQATTTATPERKQVKAAIIGCSVAGLGLLTLAALVFSWRRLRKPEKNVENISVISFPKSVADVEGGGEKVSADPV